MKSGKIYAVILAGGGGDRLWPVSTPESPKQFLDLFGDKPLIRHSVDRLKGFVPPERTLIVTSAALVGKTRKVLPTIPKENIIGEPMRRDTAAAMAVACGLVKRLGGPDAVACVLAADQLMSPDTKVRRVLKQAAKVASEVEAIVTLGIVPTYPATGFGYIESGSPLAFKGLTRFNQVKRFVEKPDEKTARRYLKNCAFRWNAGMFIWKTSVLEAAFKKHAADIASLIDEVAAAKNVEVLLKRRYEAVRKISFDFAVMEKLGNIVVAECDFKWDDVGSWQSLANHLTHDSADNVLQGEISLLDSSGIIAVNKGNHRLALLGLKDVVVVHTPQATLVCARDRVQEIKKLLSVK